MRSRPVQLPKPAASAAGCHIVSRRLPPGSKRIGARHDQLHRHPGHRNYKRARNTGQFGGDQSISQIGQCEGGRDDGGDTEVGHSRNMKNVAVCDRDFDPKH